MRSPALIPGVVFLLALAAPSPAGAWGKTGHAVVADIAEQHLSPAAAAEVKRLLAVDGARHLEDIASWADQARKEGVDGSPSHTIRLPLDGGNIRPHACSGHFCADDAMELYSAVLADPKKSDAEREVALKFIVHLVGDLQQPLHDVDAVGTSVKVVFDGKLTNLHQVWDSGIIKDNGQSAEQIADELGHSKLDVKTGGTPMDWAAEGRVIAQTKIYNTVTPFSKTTVMLPASYARDNWPIVAMRLDQGGLRLAEILNKLLQ